MKSRSVHEARKNYLKTVNVTLETPAMGLNLLACRGKTNPARPLGEAMGHFWAILINYVFMENVPT